jgi:glycerol 3-phosphatase-2
MTESGPGSAPVAPVAPTTVRIVLCDLDGVIWRGDQPIVGSARAVEELRAAGLRVGFLTNNSSGTRAEYVRRLAAAGVDAAPDDIVSSAMAAAALLAELLPAGERVFACAGPGVVEALGERGFEVVGSGPAAAVVVGWHRTFDFDELAAAAGAIRAGAVFVATNSDPTYPAAEGLLPGNGALVAAVATASGSTPVVAGKPEAAMIALARERFGHRGVMVGDRPSTDGALAAALGWPFVLVLSGVAGRPGEEPVPDPAPPVVAADLASAVTPILGLSG